MFGSHSFLSILILLPWAFFSPLSPPAHYRTPPLYVRSPLTFFPLWSSLVPLTPLSCAPLSPSICWNSAADNACNWSDSHFFSVFGPDKEYCQHFADTASAGRIKWTLFCSVCSKLKASQFICSPPRLTGASYSHRSAAEMWRQENKREGTLRRNARLPVYSRQHSDGGRRRGQDRQRRTGRRAAPTGGFIIQPAAVSCCLCSLASLHDKDGFPYAINSCMFRDRMGGRVDFWPLVSCSFSCRSTLQNKVGADGEGRGPQSGPERRTIGTQQGPEVFGSNVRPVVCWFPWRLELIVVTIYPSVGRQDL